MVFVALVLASLLDPIRFLVILGIMYFASRHERWGILKTVIIAVIVSAFVSETVLTLIQHTRHSWWWTWFWTVQLLAGIVGGLIQAIICHRLVTWINRPKD